MFINDAKEIRELFSGFRIEKVNTVYSSTKSARKKVTELLIMNFIPLRKK